MITIALDAMGGDHGPSVVVPAASRIAKSQRDVCLILVGDQGIIKSELAKLDELSNPKLKIQHAEEVVAMDEPPVSALKNKRKSSMRVALNLVRDGQADACVSAGNTGALMAIARFVLKMLPGIMRPAIITQLPSSTGFTYVLDLGANVDCNAEHLMQFAVMGSVLAKALQDKSKSDPSVGLLNIGEEDIKGNEQVKLADALISSVEAINYIGYVEGNDIYNGRVDVVVCDGFVGNIALKTSEGLVKMVYQSMRGALLANLWTKLVALLVKPILKGVVRRLDPKRYNGACLVGLKKTVIKSHGSADIEAFSNAIQVAIRQSQQNVPKLIQDEISHIIELQEKA